MKARKQFTLTAFVIGASLLCVAVSAQYARPAEKTLRGYPARPGKIEAAVPFTSGVSKRTFPHACGENRNLSDSIASASPAAAWTSGGPYGGAVYVMVMDPSNDAILYAGAINGGVFKSDDAGATWIPKNSGLTNLDVWALAIDPSAPNTIYAGVAMGPGGVFKSTDAGEHWEASISGIENMLVLTLAIDPGEPKTLYAGTNHGVFKSIDAGSTWAADGTDMMSKEVDSLAIDPMNHATLYAGTNHGIYKSSDGGNSWVSSSNGITALTITHVAIDRSAPSTLYAATYDEGIFKSTNAGGSWTVANVGLSNLHVYVIAIDPSTPSTLYAGTFKGDGGIFKSTDAGATWTVAGEGLTDLDVLPALVVDPVSPSMVYAGTNYGGVFKTTNGGGTWSASNAGLTNQPLRCLTVNPEIPSTVYAGTWGNGLFMSMDGGTSWKPGDTSLWGQDVLSVVVDPADPTTLYAGTYFGGAYKSFDGGRSWRSINQGLTNLNVWVLAMDPATPSTLYAGTFGGGVFKSTDSGVSWMQASTNLTNLNIMSLAIDPKTLNTLYAGSFGGGAFKSNDGGQTWAPVGTGMSHTASVWAIAVDPQTHTTVYAGTAHGLFKSTDAAASWFPSGSLGGADNSIDALVIDPYAPSTIYAGLALNGGIFESMDTGATWTEIDSGLPNLSARTLALDPKGPVTLYAGFADGSVWQRTWDCSPPSVNDQPASQAISYGERAVLSVSATGRGPLVYQWYEGSAGVTTTPVGDGTNAYDTGPMTSSASYWVRVSDGCGQTNSEAAEIRIGAPALAAVASASTNGGVVPLTIDFSGEVLSGTPPYAYDWDFDDGTPHGKEADVQHIFSTPGTYMVTLTVTDSTSETAMDNHIRIHAYGPLTYNLSADPTSGSVPLKVDFNGTVSGGDGTYAYHPMDYGDGQRGFGPYTYAISGTYIVTQTVTDGAGHSVTSDPIVITATPPPLTVSATATTTSGSAPLSAMFACAPHGGTPPYTYDWNFGDGTAHATNPSPAHVFESAGVYTVTLTVTDSATQTAVDDHIHVNVYGPLTFHLTAHPSSGTAPLEVHFTGAASDGDGDYTFGPIYYGDGTSGYGPHTYNQPGTYQATQTVSDGSGHTAPSAPVTITVLQAPVITSVSKAGSPFRLKVLGSHFLAGCVVKIDGQAVPQTKFKNDGKLVAKKGRMLKAMVPKGQTVTITVVNPDGGTSTGYPFTR